MHALQAHLICAEHLKRSSNAHLTAAANGSTVLRFSLGMNNALIMNWFYIIARLLQVPLIHTVCILLYFIFLFVSRTLYTLQCLHYSKAQLCLLLKVNPCFTKVFFYRERITNGGSNCLLNMQINCLSKN